MLEWGIRKKIERAFYDYKENAKRGAEYISDLAYEGTVANLSRVGGSSGKVGNPTEVKGIKALNGDKDYLWAMVVENTAVEFKRQQIKTNVKKDKLISMRYFKKLKEKDICYKLNIERETMYRWVSEIITYATMLALQLGLIKINLEEGYGSLETDEV